MTSRPDLVSEHVSPRRDAQARRENIAKLTALGLGVRPEVDQHRLSAGTEKPK